MKTIEEDTGLFFGCAFIIICIVGIVLESCGNRAHHKSGPVPPPIPWTYGKPLPVGWGVWQVTVKDGKTNMWIQKIEEE